jgi:hypothetical protein
MINLDQEDRQLIFSRLNFYHPSRNNLSFGILTCRDLWCFTYDDFEPFTRLAWNQIVPSTLDTQSIDEATSRQQDSEMSGVATITRKDGGK